MFLRGEEANLSKQHDQDEQPKSNEFLRAFTHFSHVGVTMAASVLVGVLLGKYLDEFFNTSPWLLLIFSFLGVGAAIKVLFNIPNNK